MDRLSAKRSQGLDRKSITVDDSLPVDYNDLIDTYGTCAKAADELGYNRQTVHRWKDAGIPEAQQLEIHRRTRGAMKADASIIAKYREILRAA